VRATSRPPDSRWEDSDPARSTPTAFGDRSDGLARLDGISPARDAGTFKTPRRGNYFVSVLSSAARAYLEEELARPAACQGIKCPGYKGSAGQAGFKKRALHEADFMGYVNSNLAREAGRLNRWREKFWSRRYRAIVASQEEGAQRERLK
jgi:hypothetical protein